MTQLSDLPKELIEEILRKVPLTSLKDIRCTCKKWNALSKNLILSKVEKQFLSFMMKDSKVCSIQFDLQGIHKDEEEVYPLIKKVDLFEETEISKVFHCDGLLLCIIKDNKWLFLWNPYLGETKWIPRKKFSQSDRLSLGYDKNRNHKILRLFSSGYEIYDLRYDSWSVCNLSPNLDWEIKSNHSCVSFKGNTYFVARKKREIKYILLCFDFTSERFRLSLPLPFTKAYMHEIITMSCVGEDKLAVLHSRLNMNTSELDIWLTNKLDGDPKVTSWSKFVNLFPLHVTNVLSGSFFIDEEKEVAVVFDINIRLESESRRLCEKAHIIGQGGFYKNVNIGETMNPAALTKYCFPYVCSSYVPSLVQLQNTKTRRRKNKDIYD